MLRRWWWLILMVLAAAAAGGWYYWNDLRAPAAEEPAAGADFKKGGKGGPGGPGGGRPVPVSVKAAVQADVNVYTNALGTVSPVNTVTVRSRVDGQLVSVAFREGQMVKEGDLLAQIDPRPFQVQLAQAEGQLAKDEALLGNARADLERYRTLFQQDSIARQQLDTQAALVRQYEATLKADQAAIENAKLQLSYARITAPLSGRLGLRQIDPGNIVRSGDANGLVVITQVQPVNVVFPIPEDSLPPVIRKLRANERLPVEAYDRAGKLRLATGTLLTADNQIDPATGTIKLKAQFANADSALFPSQFVNVRMRVDVLKGAVVVPGAAIQRGTPGTFVYVVDAERKASVRRVQLGPVDGDNIVVEGVQPGEAVVYDGAERLREGATVELPGDVTPPSRRAAKGAGKGGKGDGGKGGNPPAVSDAPATGAPATGPTAGGAGRPSRDVTGNAASGGGGAGEGGGGNSELRALYGQLLTQSERDGFRERMQAAAPEERGKIRREMRALLEKRAKEKGITLPPPPPPGGPGAFGGGGRPGN